MQVLITWNGVELLEIGLEFGNWFTILFSVVGVAFFHI